MILKMNNKSDNFYNYMGKFFGSRIVQSEINDRIFDDNNKIWYICIDDNNSAVGFVSICDNIIKNVYSKKDSYLIEILNEIQNDMVVSSSIVPTLYEKAYRKCKFSIRRPKNLKNFITIQTKETA